MSSWELRDPFFLLLGVLAPIVYLLAARLPATLTYSTFELVGGAPRSLRVRLARLPALLLAGATLCIVVALAGPRTGDSTTKIKREGIAIMMVFDRSGSMLAIDSGNKETRLELVRDVFQEFVDGRPQDYIGLVGFAHYADGLCPLTLDHSSLKLIVKDLEIPVEEDERGRTAIGEGLALALERLRRQEVKSRVAILLTDGENNAGEISPTQAATLAKELDIKVHTIGVGGTGEAHVMVQVASGRMQAVPTQSRIDEKTLRRIAVETGGQYFHAGDRKGLQQVYDEIDRLERSEVTEIKYLQFHEEFERWTQAALGLIVAAIIAGGTLLRRLP
ncbi:MAG: VWA domain-containing protein [Planctomycetota bacterium]